MLTKSQEELLKQVDEAIEKENFSYAEKLLNEILMQNNDETVLKRLVRVFLDTDQFLDAYELFRENWSPLINEDLFSLYCEILAKNNFRIEFEELKNESSKFDDIFAKYDLQINPVSEVEEKNIVKNFLVTSEQIPQKEYLKFKKVSSAMFITTAKNIIESNIFNVNIQNILWEDLIRLQVNKVIDVKRAGEQFTLIPAEGKLFNDEPILYELNDILIDHSEITPQNIELFLNQSIFIVSQLYPVINEIVTNTNTFVNAVISYYDQEKTNKDTDINRYTKIIAEVEENNI